MKHFLLAACAVAALVAAANAATSVNYMSPGGKAWVIGNGGSLTVRSGGTFTSSGALSVGGVTQPIIRYAFDAIASGQTAKTVTVTGATASSRCVATAAEVATNAVYIRAAVPGANQVVVTASADPGASNLDVTVMCMD